jgi:predicted enzyme related to lactoylglutathione lyase
MKSVDDDERTSGPESVQDYARMLDHSWPWRTSAGPDWKGEEETMNQIPSGTEVVRTFVPAKDFDLSKKFYETLGFEKLLDEDVAIFEVGSSGFILQRHYQKEWAENFMMQLMVDDLDAWWEHIVELDLPGKFKVPPPRAPAMQPWGLRIAYVVDPSGVLWHIAERRDGVVHD